VFGVAWMGGLEASSAPAFRLATPDAEPLGDAITLTEARGCTHLPDLAWTGSEFGVAWQDSRHDEVDRCDLYSSWPDDNWEIYFARVGMCE